MLEAKDWVFMVLSAVDGTHIPIMQPYVNSQDYYSYKMKYTLNVQSVCDYSGKFIDADIRWPGTTHYAKVFSYSSINGVLKEQTQPYLCRTLLPVRDKVGLLLPCDPAYPLLPYIIKEDATCTTDAEVLFNQMIHDARNAIECAYRRLKERWQILTMPINFKLQDVPSIILACFVFYNCCEQHNVGIDDAAVHQQIQQDSLIQPSRAVERRYTYTSLGGTNIRNITVEPQLSGLIGTSVKSPDN